MLFLAHLCVPHDVIGAKMIPPSGRTHPQLHSIQVWSKLDWQFQRYKYFCILPHLPNLTIIRPSSTWDMTSELTPQQLITQSAKATADAIASTLTARTASTSLPTYDWAPKMPTTPSPYFSIPWRTGSSSTASCLPARTTSDTSLQPWEPNPGDACTMDVHRQQRETESDQGKSFCLPWLNPTGNDTQCQHPCAPWRTQGCCGQAGRGLPRSHCMHQDTNGPLQDDQWWALQAWTALPYHPFILPWGKAPWETYGKAIQDTSSELADIAVNHFAIQHAQEQVSHSSKTCGCNLPGQAVSSPTQPQ